MNGAKKVTRHQNVNNPAIRLEPIQLEFSFIKPNTEMFKWPKCRESVIHSTNNRPQSPHHFSMHAIDKYWLIVAFTHSKHSHHVDIRTL